MDTTHVTKAVINSLIFSGLGMAVFVAGFYLIRLLLPYDVHKEIEQDHNTALAIVIGSFIVGLAVIVAAAIHG